MWGLFDVHLRFIGVFDSLALAERAKGELVVKHNCGTSHYRVKELLVNKIYEA